MADRLHGKRWLAFSGGGFVLSISFDIANQKWGTNFPNWLLYLMFFVAGVCLLYWLFTTAPIQARIRQGLWDNRILDPIPNEAVQNASVAPTTGAGHPNITIAEHIDVRLVGYDGSTFRLTNNGNQSAVIVTFHNEPDSTGNVGEVEHVEAEVRFFILDHNARTKHEWARSQPGVWLDRNSATVDFPLQSISGRKQRTLILVTRTLVADDPNLSTYSYLEWWHHDHTSHKAVRVSGGGIIKEGHEIPFLVEVKLTSATYIVEYAFKVTIDGPTRIHYETIGKIRR